MSRTAGTTEEIRWCGVHFAISELLRRVLPWHGSRRTGAGLVVMTRSDGTAIARWPELPADVAKFGNRSPLVEAMAAGEVQGRIEGISSADGKDRISAFRRLERYPIYVLAGVDREAIIAGWQKQLAVLAAFTFPISMALIYVVWRSHCGEPAANWRRSRACSAR